MSGGNVDSDSSDVELRELTDTPLFLGYIISFFLQGVLVVQVFAYFIAFKRDQMYIKLAVWFVFLLEWVSTVISTVAALECLPLSGRLAGLTTSILFKLLSPACGLVILVVHAFYCYRIHLLGAHVMVPIIIFTLSIGQCVMVSIAGLMSVPEAENTRLHDALLGASFVAWLSLAAAGDCLIAVALMLLLTRASRNLSTVAAKTRVQRAMMICVETGSITGLATLLELALYLVFMQSFIHVVLFYMLSKLYSNCMLATLNIRLALPGSTSWGSQDGDWDSTSGMPPLVEIEERTVSDSIGSIIDNCRASRVSNGSL